MPAHFEVEGRITPVDPVDLSDACTAGRRAHAATPADGRLLDFSIADERGMIRSTGRGLYTV